MDEFGDDKMAIGCELSLALKAIGAPADLQRIVGCYGETLDDEEVLRQLRAWNAGAHAPLSSEDDRKAAEQGGGPA